MTPDDIIAELNRLRPWFHRIDLGMGITTKSESVMGEPVDHPREVWQNIQQHLPQNMQGQTLLDIGCNAGFYVFEAKRRGATRVVGVDGQRQHVRQALFVRKILGLDVEFRRLNVYELDQHSIGQFDITLALGLVYHLKHLVLALENLYKVTRRLLIVETAIMPPDKTPQSFSHPLGNTQMQLHPLAIVENPPQAKEQVCNWFLPSPEALRALLINTGFDEVDIAEIKNERAVLVCRKTGNPNRQEIQHHYVASLSLKGGPAICKPAADVIFTIRVSNTGLMEWPARGEDESKARAVQLGVHLLRSDEEEVSWDFGRAPLPADLEPGQTVDLTIELRAPAEPGSYIVEFDMVHEQVAWFEDFGSGILRHELTVDESLDSSL